MNEEFDSENIGDNSNKKDKTLAARVRDEGFWREMWHQLRLVWRLLISPDVPIYLKLLPVLAVIYLFVPTDFLPDFIPGLGQLDDLTALLVGAKIFIELAPQEVVTRQMRSMRSQVNTIRDDNPQPTNGSNIENAESIVIDGDFQVLEGEDDNRVN